MKNVISFGVVLAGAAVWAAPSVSVTSVTQDQATHEVTVAYELTDGPAIVTADFLLEGETVARQPVRSVTGDVNRKVSKSEGSIRWFADKDWCGEDLGGKKIEAKLRAWPLSSPPEYMVVDLTIAGDNIRYYRSPDHFPWDGGVSALDSKYFRMIFRRIPAAGVTWQMGSPTTEPNRVSGNSEKLHAVLLTNDYYLAVFPTTQRQYYYLTGEDPSEFKGGANPVECTFYYKLRGEAPTYDWPNTGLSVDPASFLGKLRTWTGNAYSFDLPTEAEWEYAARAGTGTCYNNPPAGSNVADDSTAVAWNSLNANSRTHEVGLLKPNNFGLYDTLGNVREWCRDWWQNDSFETGSVTVNPEGPTEATEFWTNPAGISYGKRILRGWAWYWNAAYSRSARRDDRMGDHDTRNSIGFRVWAPIAGPEQEETDKTETVNGLGDLAGQQNAYWDTQTRRNAVVGVDDDLTEAGGLVGPVSTETQKIVLLLRDWFTAWGVLPLLNFNDPSGLILFFR